MARIGFSMAYLSEINPASAIFNMISAVATFRTVVHSLILESPTITWSRRYSSGSACGSSRVFIIGRERVVALETESHICSAL